MRWQMEVKGSEYIYTMQYFYKRAMLLFYLITIISKVFLVMKTFTCGAVTNT